MKWTDAERETTYRLKRAQCTPAGDTTSNPAATASDIVRALRANPEAMAEVTAALIPADGLLQRALAAEKALSALRWQVEHEGCAASHEGETTYECRHDPRCGLCRLRGARDAALSKVAEVERERDAYKRAKSEDDDRFMCERDEAVARERAAIKLAAQIARERDNAQDRVNALREVVERAAKAGYPWAHNALVVIDARGSAAPAGQYVESERAEWKALADEFARDAVSLEPAREIVAEYRRAAKKFGPFHNGHEGYAVLLEEVDELWEAVRMQYGPERDAQMRKEVVQVGAMALRFLLDVCDATAQDKTPGGADRPQATDYREAPLRDVGKPAVDAPVGPSDAQEATLPKSAPTGGLLPEQRAEVEAIVREVVLMAALKGSRRNSMIRQMSELEKLAEAISSAEREK